MKTCKQCGESKPESQMAKSKAQRYYGKCNECCKDPVIDIFDSSGMFNSSMHRRAWRMWFGDRHAMNTNIDSFGLETIRIKV